MIKTEVLMRFTVEEMRDLVVRHASSGMITRHRRRDGLLSIVDADEADGLPPMQLLEGGAGG
jgi:hypothetical protein